MRPPPFPAAWTGVPVANYTMVGYDAGELNVQFQSDCSAGPAQQKMLTIYPDKYTVLTRCDEGWNYIIDPASRGHGCTLWPIKGDTCAYCACPFCLRNTNAVWGSDGPGEVTWTSNASSISSVTGEAVMVWKGTQPNGDSIEHAVSEANGLPVTQIVTSTNYLTIGTWFQGMSIGVSDDTFDPQRLSAALGADECPAPPRSGPTEAIVGEPLAAEVESAEVNDEKAEAAPEVGATAVAEHAVERRPELGSAVGFVDASNRSVPAPALPTRFHAEIVTNISQPGYEGGNVKTVVSVDCSDGPSRQRMRTTYGNFHTVMVDCAESIVRSFDLAGIGCSTLKIGSQETGVDARVCETCGLPFGIRDTNGIYRTGAQAVQMVSWGEASTAPDGATTYHGRLGGASQLELNFTFAPNGTPLHQHTGEPGWQQLIATFVTYSEDNDIGAETFVPPVCFEPLATVEDSFWAGWASVGCAAALAACLVIGLRVLQAYGDGKGASPSLAAQPVGASGGLPSWRHAEALSSTSESAAASATAVVPEVDGAAGAAARRTARWRAGRRALLIAYLVGCYALAATFEGPQVLQSNQPPHSLSGKPTLDGGGYCYSRTPCEAYSGTFKPPWWHNPTAVVGASANTRLITAYYSYLLVVALLALLTQLVPSADALCRRPLRIWLLLRSTPWHTCLGEMASLFALFALLIYYAWQALDLGALLHQDAATTLQDLGATCGHMLNLLIGLTLLPVAHALVPLGVPWERSIGYHRTLGSAVVLFGLLHISVEYANWAVTGTFWTSLLRYEQVHEGEDIWPWVVPMMEYVFVGVLVASVAALPPLRRRCYAVFLVLHVVAMPVFVAATLLHSWQAWKFSLVGLVLYLGQKLDSAVWLFAQARWPTTRLLSLRALPGDVVALRLHSEPPPPPGTAVHLLVPTISLVHWHPFTVSNTGRAWATGGGGRACKGAGQAAATRAEEASDEGDGTSTWTLHVSATGSGRWTDALLRLAHDSDPSRAPRSQSSLPRIFARYPSLYARDFAARESAQHASAAAVLLLAGGVGITPISALAGGLLAAASPAGAKAAGTSDVERALLHEAAEGVADGSGGDGGGGAAGPRPVLVWAVRTPSLVVEFLPLLKQLCFSSRATLRIHLTGAASVAATPDTAAACPANFPAAASTAALPGDCTPASAGGSDSLPLWLRPHVFSGRPDVEGLLSEWRPESRVHVCVCGPAPLEVAARAACATRARDGARVHLKEMNFTL